MATRPGPAARSRQPQYLMSLHAEPTDSIKMATNASATDRKGPKARGEYSFQCHQHSQLAPAQVQLELDGGSSSRELGATAQVGVNRPTACLTEAYNPHSKAAVSSD